jgi:predicted PurR-regulated permease PerM
MQTLANDLNAMLRNYIRAKVTLGVCSLLFYAAAMFLLRFPHAIGLSILGGVLEFIPVAGWMISATTIVGLGILTHSHWIWMAVLLGLWRLLMDYFISPRVVGQNLEIHPLLVLFAMMVGGEVGGIVGIYLSIPLMVVTRVIWRRCYSDAASAEFPPNSLEAKK